MENYNIEELMNKEIEELEIIKKKLLEEKAKKISKKYILAQNIISLQCELKTDHI